jgi:hypothetical protein
MSRFLGAAAALAVLLGAGGVQAQSVQFVAEHAIAQEGLSVGVAWTVMHTQLQVFDAVISGGTGCQQLGSTLGSFVSPSAGQFDFYYDLACQNKYILLTEEVTRKGTKATVNGTATYYAPSGAEIGTLTLKGSLTATVGAHGKVTKVAINGIGNFVAVVSSGTPVPVDFGLACGVPVPTKTVTCTGGVAQDLPSLDEALGVIAPIDLSGIFTGAVTITSRKSQTVTAALGKLSIKASGASVAFAGKHAAFGSSSGTGTVADFELLPSTPTSWSVTDAKHGVVFAVDLQSDLSSTGTVKTTAASPATLATFAVDESGTGSITWSDSSTDNIVAWTISETK